MSELADNCRCAGPWKNHA